MSILDLPPELLLNIFDHAIPASPALNYEDYFERNRTLTSFSFVHSRWARVAQEASLREVWIGNTNYRKREMQRKGRQLIQARGNGTKFLTVYGDIEPLLKENGLERWKGLVYLKNRPKYSPEHPTRFDSFARFPSTLKPWICLTALSLWRLSIWTSPFLRCNDSSSPFGLCSKTALKISGDYPPQCPHAELIHLALESPVFSSRSSFGPTPLFGSLLPQVTTLALSDSTLDYSASDLFETVGRCSKLKHLSLSIEHDDLESLLFTDAAGMHLESLHISSSAFDDLNTLLPRFTALAKGEPETIRVERVVLYEKEESLSARKLQMADSDVFEWRGDRGQPPFEDFDGR